MKSNQLLPVNKEHFGSAQQALWMHSQLLRSCLKRKKAMWGDVIQRTSRGLAHAFLSRWKRSVKQNSRARRGLSALWQQRRFFTFTCEWMKFFWCSQQMFCLFHSGRRKGRPWLGWDWVCLGKGASGLNFNKDIYYRVQKELAPHFLPASTHTIPRIISRTQAHA